MAIYPSNEKRTPRQIFTKKLEKICARLDASPSATVTFRHPSLRKQCKSEVAVKSLWVFGSYARGALHCGDLDLIVEVELRSGVWPTSSIIQKALLGSMSYVRAYLGTPEDNDSGVVQSDAHLVWQPGRDWKKAIDEIKPDPSAGRFERSRDSIPLRSEQLRMTVDELDTMVALHNEGVLKWNFVPLDAVAPVSEPDEQEQAFSRKMRRGGARKRALLPYVLGYLRKERSEWRGSGWNSHPVASHACDFRYSGSSFFLGPTNVPYQALDTLDTVRLVIFPYLNTRGPNGFWVIERGENHPIVRSIADKCVWTLQCANGSYATVRLAGSEALGVDVFEHEGDAQAFAEQLNQDPEDASAPYLPCQVRGAGLLALLAQADALLGDFLEVAYTHEGIHGLISSNTRNEAILTDTRKLIASLPSDIKGGLEERH